jgi:hypothetical protein
MTGPILALVALPPADTARAGDNGPVTEIGAFRLAAVTTKPAFLASTHPTSSEILANALLWTPGGR